MAKRTSADFIAARAEDLAVVYLTRRDDLLVARQPAEYGIDLLVTVRRGGDLTGRLFGARTEGTLVGKLHRQRVDRVGSRQPPWVRSIPFPVCLFVFNMADDHGHYAWLKEPIVSSDGAVRLRVAETNPARLTSLTDEAVAAILARVNDWYDRQEAAHTAA